MALRLLVKASLLELVELPVAPAAGGSETVFERERFPWIPLEDFSLLGVSVPASEESDLLRSSVLAVKALKIVIQRNMCL